MVSEPDGSAAHQSTVSGDTTTTTYRQPVTAATSTGAAAHAAGSLKITAAESCRPQQH